jgi:uncharacterized protein with HEPN domain
MPPREAKKLLFDVQQAAAAIAEFTAGKTLDDYRADRMLRSAVERQFEIIGEALAQLTKADVITAAGITDRQRIIGFRNVLIHGYSGIRDDAVWEIVSNNLPTLRSEIDALLNEV